MERSEVTEIGQNFNAQKGLIQMKTKRITKHPILEIPKRKEVEFTWNGEKLNGYEGETIALPGGEDEELR